MPKSTITSQGQTTVPRDVRELLGVGPGNTLTWEVAGNEVRVSSAGHAFLLLRGTIRTGAGSTADDVTRARRERGRERS